MPISVDIFPKNSNIKPSKHTKMVGYKNDEVIDKSTIRDQIYAGAGFKELRKAGPLKGHRQKSGHLKRLFGAYSADVENRGAYCLEPRGSRWVYARKRS